MKKVIIYSTATWPWCTKVKDYLDSKSVSSEVHNVSEDRDKAMEMIEKSGQQGVPVLDIEGDIVVGFDQDKIDKLLGL